MSWTGCTCGAGCTGFASSGTAVYESCAGMLGRGSGVASVIGTSISSSYSYVTVESGVSATTL